MTQTEFPFSKDVQKRDEVFYVRCRKRVKQLLLLRQNEAGFDSMSDWFEQFVLSALAKAPSPAKRKSKRKVAKKARKKSKKTVGRKNKKGPRK